MNSLLNTRPVVRRFRHVFHRVLFLTFGMCLGATAVYACAFHNYVPQKTLIDDLLDSVQIVKARPSVNDPLRFRAMESLGTGLELVEIPQRVDDITRQRFAEDPTGYVVFGRKKYGPWRRMANVDKALAPVVADILERLPLWQVGADDDRVDFFATMIGHPDIRVHRLALRELDRVDYAVLQKLELAPLDSRIIERMTRLSDPTLQPIQILLLGLSGTQEFRSILKDGITKSVTSKDVALGAYVTAYIESIGPKAVFELSRAYLADQSLPEDSRELIIAALAIHNQTGGDSLKHAIRTAIGQALEKDTRIAPMVARQFGLRNDWSLRDTMADLLKVRAFKSPAEIFMVSRYVALGQQAVVVRGD